MTVAVLFARADSHYKALPDCDVYDMERDARTYDGPHITKAEREHTPPELAKWLAELAARCKAHNAGGNGPSGVAAKVRVD